MLERLVGELEVLGRSEVRFGISARLIIAALVLDYFNSMGIPEPPIPTYPAYVWPEGLQTFE